jgi:hypothetical protein
MRVKLDEVYLGMGPEISQAPLDELTLPAIIVEPSGDDGPPPEFKFPWLWVGVGAAAAVVILMAKTRKPGP